MIDDLSMRHVEILSLIQEPDKAKSIQLGAFRLGRSNSEEAVAHPLTVDNRGTARRRRQGEKRRKSGADVSKNYRARGGGSRGGRGLAADKAMAYPPTVDKPRTNAGDCKESH